MNRHERRSQMTRTRLGIKHKFREVQHERKVEAAKSLRHEVAKAPRRFRKAAQ